MAIFDKLFSTVLGVAITIHPTLMACGIVRLNPLQLIIKHKYQFH